MLWAEENVSETSAPEDSDKEPISGNVELFRTRETLARRRGASDQIIEKGRRKNVENIDEKILKSKGGRGSM